MKKIVFFLIVMLALPALACADVDLSGMTFDELVALKDQINLAIWNSDQWQEVTVPQGVWVVGEDIPAGHWTIRAADKAMLMMDYGDRLDDDKKSLSWAGDIYYSEMLYGKDHIFFDEDTSMIQTDIEAEEGCYFIIKSGNAIFTPYAGKPSLGFK